MNRLLSSSLLLVPLLVAPTFAGELSVETAPHERSRIARTQPAPRTTLNSPSSSDAGW